MKSLNRYRVQAGSIIESVIAMTVIAICLSMALIIYTRVLDTDYSLTQYKARQKVKELLWESKTDQAFMDEDYTFESYSVEKKVEALEAKNSYVLTFIIKVQSKKEVYKYIVSK